MSDNPRYENYTARKNLRERIRLQGAPCALCGRPIDYTLKTPDPWSYELDEDIPLSRGGSPIDPDNVQPVHRFCNRRKSAMTTTEYRERRVGKNVAHVQQIGCSQNW